MPSIDPAVIATLKPDIESVGELSLAIRELESLLPRHKIVPRSDLAVGGRVDALGPPLSASERGLLDRLAYSARVEIGDEVVVPQQAALEDAMTEAKGRATSNRRSREYLGHGVHKYKAKFFPRFARSLINICCPSADGIVLDPYCGSGTTLAEAALMGLKGVGTDIDPLSCKITEAKLKFPTWDLKLLQQLVSRIGPSSSSAGTLFNAPSTSRPYQIPHFLRKKMALDDAESVEAEMSSLYADLKQVCNGVSLPADIVASHTISTKISLRWVGTGENRFALELGSRDCRSVARSHLRRLLDNHPASIGWSVPHAYSAMAKAARIIKANAGKTTLQSGSVDAVVTSPPYLPASSGRETYLRSRAPALVLLDLLDEGQIHALDATDVTGSILRDVDRSPEPLPEAVTDLVEWMRPQRARGPKSDPTLVYFRDIIASARESARVLRSGGRAAFVVASRHMFYELVSRDVVRSFPLAEVLREILVDPKYGVGFSSAEIIELELFKADFKARPASRHSYSESVVLAQK